MNRVDDADLSEDPFRVLKALYETRHSCRAFLPTPVPRSTVEAIVGLAGRAPSGCNSQPWHVHVTEGRATQAFRDALVAEATARPAGSPDFDWPTYESVYRTRRRECGHQLYTSLGIPLDDRAASHKQTSENFKFFGAPNVAIVSTDAKLGAYGVLDTGAFVISFILAAQSLGISTVPQAALALHPQFIRKWFGMPDERLIVCGISFGYGDLAHPINDFRTTRASLDEIMTLVTS